MCRWWLMFVVFICVLFCVKQKTAYELRVSDWSSDVCSSDLTFAEECADAFGFSREAQDAYALESLRRAHVAISEGRCAEEIVALKVTQGKQQRQIRDDEQPPKAMPEKIPSLKPAFRDRKSTRLNSSH